MQSNSIFQFNIDTFNFLQNLLGIDLGPDVPAPKSIRAGSDFPPMAVGMSARDWRSQQIDRMEALPREEMQRLSQRAETERSKQIAMLRAARYIRSAMKKGRGTPPQHIAIALGYGYEEVKRDGINGDVVKDLRFIPQRSPQ